MLFSPPNPFLMQTAATAAVQFLGQQSRETSRCTERGKMDIYAVLY